MARCVLWEDKTFANKLFSSFIARRTPTRNSPDSPLKKNIVIHLTNQDISIKLEHVTNYNYSKTRNKGNQGFIDMNLQA